MGADAPPLAGVCGQSNTLALPPCILRRFHPIIYGSGGADPCPRDFETDNNARRIANAPTTDNTHTYTAHPPCGISGPRCSWRWPRPRWPRGPARRPCVAAATWTPCCWPGVAARGAGLPRRRRRQRYVVSNGTCAMNVMYMRQFKKVATSIDRPNPPCGRIDQSTTAHPQTPNTHTPHGTAGRRPEPRAAPRPAHGALRLGQGGGHPGGRHGLLGRAARPRSPRVVRGLAAAARAVPAALPPPAPHPRRLAHEQDRGPRCVPCRAVCVRAWVHACGMMMSYLLGIGNKKEPHHANST